MRYQINVTYNCNLKCKWCLQFLDVMKWEQPSDVEIEDLSIAAKILKDKGIEIDMIKVEGGEPLLHPKLREILSTIVDEWPCGNVKMYTNGTLPMVRFLGVRNVCSPLSAKVHHSPCMVSPFDLGISVDFKLPVRCGQVKRCGVLFDRFGFGPCPCAGGMGRILGKDLYSIEPMEGGMDYDVCKHCKQFVGKTKAIELGRLVEQGKVEYPTKTYQEGLERERDDPTIFKTFRERLMEKWENV